MSSIEAIEPDDLRSIPTFRAAYSDRTALLMARLALRGYSAFDVDDIAFRTFSGDLMLHGFTNCKGLIDRDVGTAGYIAEGPDLIVVVFRGTEDELDWRTNVNARFVVLQGGARVHTGFFQAYWPIRETMFDFVRSAVQAKPRPIYITGHSLGGALALMATAELANDEDDKVRDCVAACYTFGCPRAGDGSFDTYVKAPLYRVTSGIDIVPALPPAILGYRHVGDTRYLGKPGLSPARRSPNMFQKIWRTMLGLTSLLKSGSLLNVADHQMQGYAEKLAAWANENRQETRQRREKTADPKITGNS